jgi:7-keto-8-aminopelargonate synthetase-like enzyme
MEKGINAQAVFYPVVPESDARLRFFVTKGHSKDLLEKSAEIISRLYNEIC